MRHKKELPEAEEEEMMWLCSVWMNREQIYYRGLEHSTMAWINLLHPDPEQHDKIQTAIREAIQAWHDDGKRKSYIAIPRALFAPLKR